MPQKFWTIRCENGEHFNRRTKTLALKYACEIIEQEIAWWAKDGAKSSGDAEMLTSLTAIEKQIADGEYEAAVNAWRELVNNGWDGKGEVIVEESELD